MPIELLSLKKNQGAKRAKVSQCKITPVTTVTIWEDTYFLDPSLTLLSSVHVGADCFIYTSTLHWKLTHLAAWLSVELINSIGSSQHRQTLCPLFCFLWHVNSPLKKKQRTLLRKELCSPKVSYSSFPSPSYSFCWISLRNDWWTGCGESHLVHEERSFH